MARKVMRAGTLLAPVPPALVTVGNIEKHNVLTVAWTGIVCSDPALTYVSVRPSRYSHALLAEGGEFVIHLPSESQARQVDFCGIYTGAKVDKLKKCRLTAIPSEEVAAPTIAECPIALECRVREVRPLGTHDMFLAEIVAVTADEALFDEKGKLHMERAHLVAYAHGEYYGLGRVLGKFGFSTDKGKKGTRKGGKKKA